MAYGGGSFIFSTDMLQKKIEVFKDTITQLESLSNEFTDKIETVLKPHWDTDGGKNVIKDLEVFNNEQLKSFVTMNLMNQESKLEQVLVETINVKNVGSGN